MKPYLVSGLTLIALAVVGVFGLNIDRMGPWGAAGVATVLGTIGGLVTIWAFGERLNRRRRG